MSSLSVRLSRTMAAAVILAMVVSACAPTPAPTAQPPTPAPAATVAPTAPPPTAAPTVPPPAPKVSALSFRSAMRKLWEDHVTWTRLYIVEFAANQPGADATAQRLLQNQVDIGNAIKPFYGDEAGTKLAALLKDHITGAVDLLNAAKADDKAKTDASSAKWYANADDIAAFLSGANPKSWPLANMKAGMKMHLDLTLQEAVDQLGGKFNDSVKDYDKVHDHILGLADLLGSGIMTQFPDRFDQSTAKQMALRNGMRKLWEDHITWTRLYIVEFTAGLPGADATAQRLLQNQVDIGNAIKPFFGDDAGTKLSVLLKDHILGAVDLLNAAKAGDKAKTDASSSKWYANADDIAAFLSGANAKSWPLADMKAGMKMHLDLTLQEAVDELGGKYADSVKDYDKVHDHILGLADLLSAGIVAQFPEKFTMVVVNDQDVLNDAVVIARVASEGPGWLTVHNQQDGKVGADIGHAAVVDGFNDSVRVRIDPSKLTPTLYAMLHTDAGVVGTYEFPGADVPVVYAGAVVNVPFKAKLAVDAAAVTVQDQALKNNTVTISVVVSRGPGWLVVHAQKDGKTGPDIGHTALVSGLNQNVVVNLDPAGITDVLYAMLHTDAGVVGTYEFPGADVPVTQSGNLVNKPFRLHPAAESPAVGLELVAQGFVAPVAMISPDDGTGRRFIVDQVGVISILPKTGPVVSTPFLDLRSKIIPLSPNYDERGLLGLAFHNDFKTNGRFYVLYTISPRKTAPAGFNCTTRVSEFKVSAANSNVADPASERVILELDKPQSNHNGGSIAMGYDGYLYIPLGDGGAANDVGLGHNTTIGNAQDTTTLLGKILRIDINSTGAADGDYGIPKDNPFADGVKGRPEIWAYGLRNPYIITFDKGGDHELFAGIAGQNRWEHFFLITKGANYGWNIREGSHCFDSKSGYDLATDCPKVGASGEPLVGPILEYPNAKAPGGYGITAVGGRVYRGTALPQFTGRYLFLDFSKTPAPPGDATLFIGTRLTAKGDAWTFEEVAVSNRPGNRIGAFVRGLGQDADGELYALTSTLEGPSGTTGAIYKLVPPSTAPAAATPAVTATPSTAAPTPTAVAGAGQTASVEMRNISFNPPTLQVKVGTKVTWTNKDDVDHTATSDTGVWDSGALSNGATFSFTFTQAGTFPYYCRPHGAPGGNGMSGTIVVVP